MPALARFAAVRGVLVTLCVGLLAAGAALGAGWAVLAAALPPPARGDRVAADAAAWLLRFRVTRSTFELNGARQSAYCLHTWFPRRSTGTLARGTLLRLDAGGRLLQNGGAVWAEGPVAAGPQRLDLLELELAGCPDVLGTRVAAAAQTADGIRVERAFAAGQPALALRLPTLYDRAGRHRFVLDRATLYVSARTFKPLLVKASLGPWTGSGRIHLTRATPALLAALLAPLSGRPGSRP